MSAQVQINNVQASGQNIQVTGFIVLSGTYPPGGDPLNFTGSGTLPATADPSFVGLIAAVESGALLNLDIWSMSGTSIAASIAGYSPACTKTGTPSLINPQTGAKLKVSALGATTEHAAATYEATYTGDIIAFQATFTKLI